VEKSCKDDSDSKHAGIIVSVISNRVRRTGRKCPVCICVTNTVKDTFSEAERKTTEQMRQMVVKENL
jgi:ACT domain-containing protein